MTVQNNTSQAINARRQIQIWAAFVAFAMRRFWWVVLSISLVGATVGYFVSLSTTNRYEVHATLLYPIAEVLPEYERLLSRKLILSAISRFNVSLLVDRDSRGIYEMYNESPFEVIMQSMPPDWMDFNHRFRLLSAHRYEIVFETAEGELRYEGEMGVSSQFGGARLIVNLTKPWNNEVADYDYYVCFNSPNALVDRFRGNLNVINLAEHSSRVALEYTDAHPQLAFDILDAFVTKYLEDTERHRNELFHGRMAEVMMEMKVLEAQILALESPDPFLQALAESGKQLPAMDTSAADWLKLHLDLHRLEARVGIWKVFLAGELDWAGLPKALSSANSVPVDSAMLRFLGQRQDWNDNHAQRLLVDSLLRADANLLKAGAEKAEAISRKYVVALNFRHAWDKTMLGGQKSNLSKELLLRDRYLDALHQASKLELEMRQDVVGPELIDPPYLLPPLGRFLRWRVLIASLILVAMFGFGVALGLALVSRRFRSPIHFQTLARYHSPLLRLGRSDLDDRHQVATLELSWATNYPLIAFVGETEATRALAFQMAERLAAIGKQVALVNAGTEFKPIAFAQVPLPIGPSQGWWFTEDAAAFLDEQSAQFDRVLLVLPPPRLEPEVLAALQHVNVVYYVLKRDESTLAEWRSWVAEAEVLGLAFVPFWVD
jgi:hypothetical protein